MGLHDYTTEILGTKSSIRILKTLLRYRGKVFTVRELARTARVSHPEVSKLLKEMERRGVVKLQPVGRAKQVSLNEESYILKSVLEPLFKAEETTVEHLVSTIRPFFENELISSVAIFGSVARGLEKKSSDIDLLVISEDKERANECVANATIAALSRFGLGLSPTIMRERAFINESERSLGKSILGSYILVAGRDLKEIVRSGKAGR